MDYFLKSLLPLIIEYVAISIPDSKEVAILKSHQYDIIYAYLRYLYTILPNTPHSCLANLFVLGASQATNTVIGLANHTIPQFEPYYSSYGTRMYGNYYGGANYS